MSDQMDADSARRMRARYTQTDDAWVPPTPQEYGEPRPGHGTIYLHLAHDSSREHSLITEAEWQDTYPESDDQGRQFGLEVIRGSREDVLTWVRSRPAETILVYSREREDWIPLPAEDAGVVIG